LRRSLPPWQQNAVLFVFGKEKGDKGDVLWDFWDLSYLDPDQILTQPILAFAAGAKDDGVVGGAMAAGSALLKPWTSEQLVVGAIMDVMRNSTVEGFPVVSEAENPLWQNVAKARHVINTLLPGSLFMFPRQYEAAMGIIPNSGRARGLVNETLGPIFGQKLGTAAPLQSFQRGQVSKFVSSRNAARSFATENYRKLGTPDLGEIPRKYAQANESYKKVLGELRRDYLAQIRLGVPAWQVGLAMEEKGVSQAEIGMVRANVYNKYTPPDDAIDAGLSLVDGKARRDALLKAIRSYPETQTLTD